MNVIPVNSQIVMAMITNSAVLAWASHGWASVARPRNRSTEYGWALGEKICRKIGAIVAGAITTGIKMTTLYRLGSRTRECSSAANTNPSSVCKQNVITKK